MRTFICKVGGANPTSAWPWINLTLPGCCGSAELASLSSLLDRSFPRSGNAWRLHPRDWTASDARDGGARGTNGRATIAAPPPSPIRTQTSTVAERFNSPPTAWRVDAARHSNIQARAQPNMQANQHPIAIVVHIESHDVRVQDQTHTYAWFSLMRMGRPVGFESGGCGPPLAGLDFGAI
ncbi:hypothetical protein EW146_g10376 [Bondarzewia mesenterica]|uniref:Uncharacterized protein n=1 Tax=Bondarzewia mesenterica TaxID=1095465 RepID=A0A4V3XBX0_9AGAM|nr:hypothetical protein EW146_g10376 [Bondarzewia mesenterica]